MEYIKDLDTLKSVLSNIRYDKLFNIYKGQPNDEIKEKIVFISDCAKSILIDSIFYLDNAEEIENCLYNDAKSKNDQILENIKNNTICIYGNTLSIHIDKYHYDNDFIRNIINMSDSINNKNICIWLSFYNVKPDEKLLFMFRRKMITVYLHDFNGRLVEISDKWFTPKCYMLSKTNDEESYTNVPYNRLMENLGNLDCLLAFDSFSITNISDSVSYCVNTGKPPRTEHKMEINNIYLNNVFNIVKKIREMGYNKNINIDCDSLIDIGSSTFNYEPLNVTFNGAYPNIDSINNLLRMYEAIAREALTCNNMSLSEKLNYIYVTLANYVDYNKELSELEKLFTRELIFNHTYDLCKLMGLKPIKVPNKNFYYFFEKHNPKIIRFNPVLFYDYFKENRIDINDPEKEKLVWDIIYKRYNENRNNNSIEKYLYANSIQEIEDIFLKSVDLSDNLYLNIIERYEDELNYLVNILMDLSEEDYLEYKNSTNKFTCVIDVISACEKIGALILDNKKKQIGITKNQIKITKNNSN